MKNIDLPGGQITDNPLGNASLLFLPATVKSQSLWSIEELFDILRCCRDFTNTRSLSGGGGGKGGLLPPPPLLPPNMANRAWLISNEYDEAMTTSFCRSKIVVGGMVLVSKRGRKQKVAMLK